MNILLTGGAGYIGSHTAVELLTAGFDVIVADNFSNSSREAVSRVEEITGKSVKLYESDVADAAAMRKIFSENKIDAVIHFAGYKAVGESVRMPIAYYRNNIDTLLTTLEIMTEYGCKKIVFSSSATVYGDPDSVPIKETAKKKDCASPYAWTKSMIEQMLMDLSVSDGEAEVTILRYFNPVGAHKSGRIGEDPDGIPNNLMPFVSQVAVGKLPKLTVFGTDYDTPDGTCVRDFIHVVDLAKGHVAALRHSKQGVNIYNLGTGVGYSVMDVITAFERVNGVTVNRVSGARREGDVPSYYGDPAKAKTELDWEAELTLDDMVRDSWNWQKKNPNGYR